MAAPLKQRLRYRIDNSLAGGTLSVVPWLGLASILLVVAIALVATLFGVRANGEKLGLIEAMWLNMLRTLDPGTMGGDVGWPFRIMSLIVTLGGIFIVSSLIGVIASTLDNKLTELRRGKSLVVETGHTLILGWSPKVFSIIKELEEANKNQRKPVIVILAPVDKLEMEELIASRAGSKLKTRIVCRSATPYEPDDIAIANPTEARSIIILNPGGDDGDAEVIKTVLAILSNELISRSAAIVTELGSAANIRSLQLATDERVIAVNSTEIIARITAQCSRQPGLSLVVRDLLDFEGDEIYFHHEPALEGRTFRESLLAFDGSTIIGLQLSDGTVAVAPPMDTRIGPDDRIIAISADDDTIRFSGIGDDTRDAMVARPRPPDPPEHALVMGWNHLTPTILHELDHYVPEGSTAVVVADRKLAGGPMNLPTGLKRLAVNIDPSESGYGAPLLASGDFKHVIITCYRDTLSDAQADARALLDLLHITTTAENLGLSLNVITELIDVRDVAIAPRASEDQFVVSEHLISLLMAQVSENAGLWPVLTDLLDPEGVEIYFEPVTIYTDIGNSVVYRDLVRAAAVRGEVAIGYRAPAESVHAGVHLNPPQGTVLTPGPDDSLIVLAEDSAT
ncbi:MAG TPA: potassium transporter TrkA [Actinomycetota bacterium]|nr:potassium transporter TrkA [Actinomycetota bacterium]